MKLYFNVCMLWDNRWPIFKHQEFEIGLEVECQGITEYGISLNDKPKYSECGGGRPTSFQLELFVVATSIHTLYMSRNPVGTCFCAVLNHQNRIISRSCFIIRCREKCFCVRGVFFISFLVH